MGSLHIAEDDSNHFSYQDVFEPIVSRTGNKYIPFNFDFNFGVKELALTGYIEAPRRGQDITLTEKGRTVDYSHFPSKVEQKTIEEYWSRKNDQHNSKKVEMEEKKSELEDVHVDKVLPLDDQDDSSDDWKIQLVEQLKQFTPKKFESFSRLLISKMGVKIDKKLGKVVSGDHGIDGFGYFESDEFRTARVAIQAKRFTGNSVSEPEIDKFKDAMDGYNAEYGIFITTSHFTDRAKEKAVKGSKSVTLIDGRRIADLVEQYHLHITPVQTFTLDEYYFEEE